MQGLLEPNARALDGPPGPPRCDAVSDSLILLHSELVMSVTRDTNAVLDARPADAYILVNRTCEMGLLHATGRPYQSFVFLLEERTRPESHRNRTSDEA
jgi:D-lactate dehydrogenase